MRFLRGFGRGLRSGFVAVGALAFLGTVIALATNYTVTQGSGTTFGSIVVSAVNYAQQLVCDPTTPSQCAAVDSSGILSVKSTTLATAAAQTGTSATTAHGCSTAGYGELGCLGQIDDDVKGPIAAGSANIGNVGLISQYPTGATPITASATGTTAATTATLAGTSGKTTYICGYSIRANATAATTVTDTITGVITATLSSTLWVAPLASGIGVDEQIFSPCIPASGTNTGIAIVSGAPGSGGTVSSKGWGYQL